MDLCHITSPADGRLAPTARARRPAVRKLVARVRKQAILFCIVDDHAHLVLAAPRARAGLLAG